MLGGHPRTSEFFPVVYAELRRIAAAQLARLSPGQTLQPTALVHEAYLKLAGSDDAAWNGAGHFFGAAAQAMREIIVDHVRRRSAKKRGEGRATDDLETAFDLAGTEMPVDDVLAIDCALRELEREHPRQANVVVMRYFAGMSVDQIALALKVTTRTVEREWRFARAMLAEALATDRAP
jgi:RNA polymerase sigma factor (TIGR02999 family)